MTTVGVSSRRPTSRRSRRSPQLSALAHTPGLVARKRCFACSSSARAAGSSAKRRRSETTAAKPRSRRASSRRNARKNNRDASGPMRGSAAQSWGTRGRRLCWALRTTWGDTRTSPEREPGTRSAIIVATCAPREWPTTSGRSSSPTRGRRRRAYQSAVWGSRRLPGDSPHPGRSIATERWPVAAIRSGTRPPRLLESSKAVDEQNRRAGADVERRDVARVHPRRMPLARPGASPRLPTSRILMVVSGVKMSPSVCPTPQTPGCSAACKARPAPAYRRHFQARPRGGEGSFLAGAGVVCRGPFGGCATSRGRRLPTFPSIGDCGDYLRQ